MAKRSPELKARALAIAEAESIRVASEETGIPEGTIKRWRAEQRTKKRTEPKIEPKPEPKPNRTEPPKKKEPAPVGAPTKFREEFVTQAFKLCLLGARDKDLADFFEVDEATIYRWKAKYPDFCEALKRGKEEADSEVAQKLFHRALGYEHPEDKVFLYKGKPVVVPVIKHYPPDTGAAAFWLKNRQPHLWRDKQEVAHSGEVINRHEFNDETIKAAYDSLYRSDVSGDSPVN
jgi:hypothetical protein